MKKAIRFALAVCLCSWAVFGIFYAACGFDVSDRKLALTIFEMFYMLMPMLVAGGLQFIDREPFSSTGLLNFRITRKWLWAPLLPVGLLAATILISGLFPGVRLHYSAEQLIAMQSLPEEAAAQVREQMAAMPGWVMILSTIFSGIVAGCTVNALFAFGEEYGWRNYMVSALRGVKFWKAALLIGFVWGIWHAPLILLGHNYPQHPVAGVPMMCVFCILLGTLELYLVLRTHSVIPAAVMHGTINAIFGTTLFLVQGGSDLTTGTAGLAGFITMAAAIAVIYLYDRRHGKIMSSEIQL